VLGRLAVQPGDVVLFLGCLTHSGAAYEEENFRIHVYIQSQIYDKFRKGGDNLLAIFKDLEAAKRRAASQPVSSGQAE
jgi:hypothetical protein